VSFTGALHLDSEPPTNHTPHVNANPPVKPSLT